MVSSDRPVSLEDEVSHSMKEMIGGCCVCSDERGWAENPLVYCDGHGCSVAVHQGKHPTARRPAGPETGLLPTVTVPPPYLPRPAATATAAPPPAGPPRPAPCAGRGSPAWSLREPGVVAAGAGRVPPGLWPRVRACGPGCHVILRSLKCHLAAPARPPARVGPLRAALGPVLRQGRVGACDPRWSHGDGRVAWGTGGRLPLPSPPLPAPVCRSVSGGLLPLS